MSGGAWVRASGRWRSPRTHRRKPSGLLSTLPRLARQLSGERLRVRPAGAPVSLRHDRSGVGGVAPAGRGGDGRTAPRPGRTPDGPPVAGGRGRGPVRGQVRGGVAGPAGRLPDWQAVYAFYERWNARGLPQQLVDRLRARLRRAGRADLPTAAVIDSQSVKAANTVGAATSGFDGGKKIKAGNDTWRWTATDGCWPCSSPPPVSRTVTAGTDCWRCCGNGRPPSPWCGPTVGTPGGWSSGPPRCCT